MMSRRPNDPLGMRLRNRSSYPLPPPVVAKDLWRGVTYGRSPRQVLPDHALATISIVVTRQGIKGFLGRWPAAKAAAYVANDAWWALRIRVGSIDRPGGTHARVSLEDSVDYIEQVMADYCLYGDLKSCSGRAAEVGPGDNAGVALLLREAGFDMVDLVERFRIHRDEAQHRQIYELLASRHDIDRLRPSIGWDDRQLSGIRWVDGSSAEDYFVAEAARGGSYDLIVSRAVLEHLYDPLTALCDMAACLRRGGRMLHKIDFRDHGMFTPALPELTFLRFSPAIYRRMTIHSGRPNRNLLPHYLKLATRLEREKDFRCQILVTSLVGVGEVVPHVPLADVPRGLLNSAIDTVRSQRVFLARRFADFTDAELAVSGIFFVGERPAASK